MAGRQRFKLKLNNSGAALVTVIIVIAFISVIVTIMLYMSGVNYYMKSTDKETKDSFYEAETAMENIRAELMLQVKSAYQVASRAVMAEFINKDEDGRKELYYESFEAALLENYIEPSTGATIDLVADMQAKSGGYGSYVNGTSPTTPIALENTNVKDGYILIKGVCITYTKDGYYTKITTDLKVQAPELNWGLDTSQTVWANEADAFERAEYTMADCVTYLNWKKE